jgi:hypothetical protein
VRFFPPCHGHAGLASPARPLTMSSPCWCSSLQLGGVDRPAVGMSQGCKCMPLRFLVPCMPSSVVPCDVRVRRCAFNNGPCYFTGQLVATVEDLRTDNQVMRSDLKRIRNNTEASGLELSRSAGTACSSSGSCCEQESLHCTADENVLSQMLHAPRR